ncbi:hypothetical protein [Candidatus Manganitrophus noduliformans]|uniref:Uncharacterized protein n=1 Tax=Candidatus Manganitrophus noduliformans TaxID=2606439 RepID=A0A7X6IB58_9BACT|nr:hypothetical protein [Candidatus Manganitrophus noduliformans]NKE71125.1 hypothetical protein [Candidatus Manganitrophus noduliformans]
MKIQTIWAVKVVPDDEAEDLHEFGLSWYRFAKEPIETDPVLKIPAKPAVWVKFSKLEQLELMQSDFPEAKLGPAGSFTEGILFAESWDKAEALRKKVHAVLLGEGEDEMGKIIKEETMEDY